MMQYYEKNAEPIHLPLKVAGVGRGAGMGRSGTEPVHLPLKVAGVEESYAACHHAWQKQLSLPATCHLVWQERTLSANTATTTTLPAACHLVWQVRKLKKGAPHYE